MEWHEVLARLKVAPKLGQAILDQLTDALGHDYSVQFGDSASLEVQEPV